MKKYDKRIADLLLVRKRGVMGGVLIEGANWCWETTAAEQISPSVPYMSDPGKKGQYLDMAEVSPRSRLPGKTPRLLDGWQLVPETVGCHKIQDRPSGWMATICPYRFCGFFEDRGYSSFRDWHPPRHE